MKISAIIEKIYEQLPQKMKNVPKVHNQKPHPQAPLRRSRKLTVGATVTENQQKSRIFTCSDPLDRGGMQWPIASQFCFCFLFHGQVADHLIQKILSNISRAKTVEKKEASISLKI